MSPTARSVEFKDKSENPPAPRATARTTTTTRKLSASRAAASTTSTLNNLHYTVRPVGGTGHVVGNSSKPGYTGQPVATPTQCDLPSHPLSKPGTTQQVEQLLGTSATNADHHLPAFSPSSAPSGNNHHWPPEHDELLAAIQRAIAWIPAPRTTPEFQFKWSDETAEYNWQHPCSQKLRPPIHLAR